MQAKRQQPQNKCNMPGYSLNNKLKQKAKYHIEYHVHSISYAYNIEICTGI